MSGQGGDAHSLPPASGDPAALSRWVLQRAASLGFASAGICAARPSERSQQLRSWLAQGRHGPMSWMERNIATRLDPTRLVDGARSIVVVADRYHDGSTDARPCVVRAGADGSELPAGRTARYARGRDYHRRIKKRMRRLQRELEEAIPGTRGKVCCDIEPLMEREVAERAGVGRCGKNTLLIAPGLGSWVLLASYVTSAVLDPTTPDAALHTDPCGSCTRCIDACPTGAITPWSVDARKCISSVTLEDRGMPSSEVASKAGEWLLGCDICQEVCPHNQPTRRSRAAGTHSEYDGRNWAFALIDVLGWSEVDRRRAFGPSALNRVHATHARRNALWCSLGVLSRGEDPVLKSQVERIAADDAEDEVLRATAREVLSRVKQA